MKGWFAIKSNEQTKSVSYQKFDDRPLLKPGGAVWFSAILSSLKTNISAVCHPFSFIFLALESEQRK